MKYKVSLLSALIEKLDCSVKKIMTHIYEIQNDLAKNFCLMGNSRNCVDGNFPPEKYVV
jgi:hypothetical protein